MIRALRLGIPLLVLALAVGMLSGGTALAARGGNGGTSASLSIYQGGAQVTTAAAENSFEMKGSGFRPDSTVYVGIAFLAPMVPAKADSTGRFTSAHPGLVSGAYTAISMVYSKGNWIIATSTPFNVN